MIKEIFSEIYTPFYEEKILKEEDKMDKRKLKLFVERHKKEMIAGAGIVLGTVVCVIVGKTICASKNMTIPITEISDGFSVGNKIKDVEVLNGFQVRNSVKNLEIPEGFSVGTVMDLFEHEDEIVTIVYDLTVNDLGRFGEELVKHGLVKDGAEAAITAEFLRNV